jgi:ubiquinone/menaquinone biosynthesis C-methylase UbiE
MTIPHENSAKYYDFVFERRFGLFYGNLTKNNLAKIKQITPSGKILDFGAGTGRISIPLAEDGFSVTAVDCSSEMLAVLKRKAEAQKVSINTEFTLGTVTSRDFDLAIAIFTVLAYIKTTAELTTVFEQIYTSLKPGGFFMFDLEKRAAYDQIYTNQNGIVNQTRNELVKIKFQDNNSNLCDYYESATGTLPSGEAFNYTEQFVIKFWTIAEILEISNRIGFIEVQRFEFANADYFILKRN